ncbi:MAG TPA: hypothetical protein VIC33_12425 [Vicinamibacterales bacterium]
MKHVFLVGVFAGALAASTAFAGPATATTGRAAAFTAAQAGAASERLATVRIPRKVTADGQPLAAGTYTLVLGEQAPPPTAEAGQSDERWVQFEQRGQVKGREIASVIGADQIKTVADGDRIPSPGRASVEMLKGGEYLRVWVNKGGENYLIHLVIAH